MQIIKSWWLEANSRKFFTTSFRTKFWDCWLISYKSNFKKDKKSIPWIQSIYCQIFILILINILLTKSTFYKYFFIFYQNYLLTKSTKGIFYKRVRKVLSAKKKDFLQGGTFEKVVFETMKLFLIKYHDQVKPDNEKQFRRMALELRYHKYETKW